MGYVEGRNLIVEARYAEGKIERLPELARELVQQKPDVIVAIGTTVIQAVKDATTTIPIVSLPTSIRSPPGSSRILRIPGGNMTRILIAPEGTLAGKKLELLKEMVPRATRIALLVPDDPGIGSKLQVQDVRKAASSLARLIVVEARGGDYGSAFATIGASRPAALFVGAHTISCATRNRSSR